ncbi:hypothetical protein BKA93DRAFT_210624 [Sparassis latifolia]|uniref:Uncharacterized protein n=1 Tax=Sparassis crispa TaxID=139825 RepID=A0A401G984_9APHY|nr:hypothetical protein SCP_0116370 [Sparassis crispa]GBE78746.1 hypothetical protein SCP_0116370 [Sparassis crispa]
MFHVHSGTRFTPSGAEDVFSSPRTVKFHCYSYRPRGRFDACFRQLIWTAEKPSKKFYIPQECFDIIFLQDKIAVLCASGLKIVTLDDLQIVSMPDFEDPHLVAIYRRYDSHRPLGIFHE